MNKKFYSTIKEKGLNAENVFQERYQFQAKGLKWFKSSPSLEATFRWLITIGVLRREVDGQGLTAKVRLTPLGRNIIDTNKDLTLYKINLLEHLLQEV